MKIIKKIQQYIECKVWDIQHYLEVRKYKRLYPDYEDNEFNCGSLKHIWGVQSCDDLTGNESHLYSMCDIGITYDREKEEYILGIETIYMFEDRKSECDYLRQLLEAFTKHMTDNGLSKEYKGILFCRGASINQSAKSIEELYFNFNLFVEGYCKVHGY